MAVKPRGDLGRLLCESRAIVAAELAVAILIVLGGDVGIVPLSSTPFLLMLGWLSLWLRGLAWRDIGFVRPLTWAPVLLLGAITGAAWQGVSLYVIEPLLARITGALPDASLFASLVGNVPMLLLTLLIIWTIAAFGEELVFRGYLINRIADAGGRGHPAWALSLLSSSALFGATHLYQGVSGIIDSGLTGLVFAALYLTTGRNLVASIVAHGTYDTVGAVLIFSHRYPGL